ncbi:DUF2933 domain-containing protein [Methanosarcina sp.]|uniref:DUF2933 domain-containing protein n=1 Tax=Methanosarcina sp. TaxID=2213 RepID=UPI003C7937C5
MNGANCNSKNNFMVKVVVLFSLATIAFYLLTEHKAHLLAYSSYILFFGFVLLHVFMCGRHAKHGGHAGREGQGGHGVCCGGHNHAGHKHGEAEKKDQNAQGTGGHDNDIDQHGHSQERYE